MTLKAFDVTEDGRSLALFSGYRAMQLSTGLRIGFNRHVEAARIAVGLDNTISNHPANAPDVRALRFTLAIRAAGSPSLRIGEPAELSFCPRVRQNDPIC